jgi:AraC-like DNA-binding protein
MKSGVATFRAIDHIYYADTCEPLKHGVNQGEVRLHACARGAYPGTPLPDESLTEVRTVGFWDADHDQSWGLDWHRNEGIEISYVARGKVTFGVGAQEFRLKGGDLAITRPWQPHRIGDPLVSSSRLYWLILDVGVRRPNHTWKWPSWLVLSDSDRAKLTENLSHNEQPVWPADEEIRYYFERLGKVVAARDHSNEETESRLKLYINGLLIALAEMLKREQPLLDPSLSSSQRTVELFLASLPNRVEEDWTLELMAAACGLGRSRLTHYCKLLTNMPPAEYLVRCRVAVAAELLATCPEASITDVALRSGFGSSQYFATVFRRHMRCSPREYRAKTESWPWPYG